MLNWRNIQRRLGVVADGIAGPITYGALLAKVGGRRPIADLGAALALHAGDYAIDATPERMAGFLGECAHESLAFTVARAIWGPTAAQRRYEGRADQIGRAHVCPVTNAHLVCRLLLEKQKNTHISTKTDGAP